MIQIHYSIITVTRDHIMGGIVFKCASYTSKITPGRYLNKKLRRF